jgi:hypothetical protein
MNGVDLTGSQKFGCLTSIGNEVYHYPSVAEGLSGLLNLDGISPANTPQMGPNKKQDSHRPRIYENGGTFDKTISHGVPKISGG